MKVGIVGSGFVGATAGYALVMQGVGREIVLVDKNTARAAAEADDIRHAVPFAHPLEVRAGGYEDLAGCRVVVLCAALGRSPARRGCSCSSATPRSSARSCRPSSKHAPDAVLVVATNPVDVMTHLAARYRGRVRRAAGRVLGSGTTLDTARFRSLLGGHCGVDPHHVHAYVIGEHGDSEVLTWSLATIGGMPWTQFARLRGIDLSEPVREDIDGKVRGAAYTIIGGKGATYYGIGSALARIVDVDPARPARRHDRRHADGGRGRRPQRHGLPAAPRGRAGRTRDISVAAERGRNRAAACQRRRDSAGPRRAGRQRLKAEACRRSKGATAQK